MSSEYGWTDEHILGMTLERIRLCREVIVERLNEERRNLLRLEEAKMRILAGAVHAAAGNKKGARAASRIRFLPPDKTELPSTQQLSGFLPHERGRGLVPAEKARGAYGPRES